MTTQDVALQTSLMTVAHDILTDVKDSDGDVESLQYATRRALRRLRTLSGSKNPDADVLQGIADRARMSDVRELGGLLDETQLAYAG